MTLHWISLEFGKPISVLLDLLDFFPIDGLVWKCIKKALFSCLKSYSISSRLLSTTSGGASESLIASIELARLLLSHHGQDISQSFHMLRCMIHTYQLGIKLKLYATTPTMKLRRRLRFIHTSKLSRAINHLTI